MRTLRYVNSLNRPGFLTFVSKKLQKNSIFSQFNDHKSGKKHGNQTNDPIFYLLFPVILFAKFIFVFENNKNSFSCGPPFDPFSSVKYLNFGQKPPVGTAHHTFLESRHPEVTTNPYYIMFPKGRQKRYQLMYCKCHKHAQQLIQNLACFCHNFRCYVTISCACIMGLNQTLIRTKT